MRGATSFTNEHSVEFVLIPALTTVLSPHFDAVVPSYFWSSREGGRMAAQCVGGSAVRLLTVFSRRPKVRFAHDGEILMRVNSEIYAAGKVGDERGCPVIAGIPLVNTLLDLVVGAPCGWFRVQADSPLGLPVDHLRIDAATGEICGDGAGLIPLDTTDLVDVARSARCMDWGETVDVIRELRSPVDGRGRWWGWAGYRPFHLLIFGGGGARPESVALDEYSST